MAHSPGTRGASPLRLHAPVVGALARGGISTGRAAALLDMVRATPAANAERVTFARALSETGSSFRLQLPKEDAVAKDRVRECERNEV